MTEFQIGVASTIVATADTQALTQAKIIKSLKFQRDH
jgi:hypothetical protein